MPRGYDSYLMGSLCQSESDGEPVANVTESTPARRPSLTDALPRIPIKLEGCGVSLTLKVGPHVRWTKILAKWSACFHNSVTAPLAWPVIVSIGEQRIAISSIQESVSRSIGPELLAVVYDRDSAIIVTVGQVDRQDLLEDVVPPRFEPISIPEPVLAPTPLAVPIPTREPIECFEDEVCVPKKPSMPLKIVIESKLVSKRTKLNVPSSCLVGRLINKWLEAARSTINADLVDLYFDQTILDRTKPLHDLIPAGLPVNDRIVLKARLNVERSPEVSPKRKKHRSESLPTPQTAASPQEKELVYWEQKRNAKSAGLENFVDEESEEWIDDEISLAIALSLSDIP